MTKHPKPPHCPSIAEEVTQELEKPELQDLTSVVMVGGFSGSVHLQVGDTPSFNVRLVGFTPTSHISSDRRS